MSGLSRTPGKRVWDNIPPRVRIPPAPPRYSENPHGYWPCGFFIGSRGIDADLANGCRQALDILLDFGCRPQHSPRDDQGPRSGVGILKVGGLDSVNAGQQARHWAC